MGKGTDYKRGKGNTVVAYEVTDGGASQSQTPRIMGNGKDFFDELKEQVAGLKKDKSA